MQLKSPFRYPGGKDKVALAILSCFREIEYENLIEPFCGGASVSIQSGASRLIMNDMDPGIADFWKRVRGPEDDYQELVDGIWHYDQFDGQEAVKEYRRLKSAPRTGISSFVINRWSCSGLGNGPLRNLKSRYNVPELIRRIEWFRLAYSGRCQVFNTDFSDVIIPDNSVLYLDPPYIVWGRKGGLYAQGMSFADHVRLANWVLRQTCPFALSLDASRYSDGQNAEIEEIIALYRQSGVTVCSLPVTYTVATSYDYVRTMETLIIGNDAVPPLCNRAAA
jgi:DNA adenine methylase